MRNIASLGDYMLATRELLKRTEWLRRACRAVRAMMEPQEAETIAVAAGE
jgi:hypothetical protein